jgi:hypothetical protein
LIKACNACLKTNALSKEPFEDLCILTPGAGNSGLEKHLYLIEIHNSGITGNATFKGLGDNGSIVHAVKKIEDDTITIINSGQDSASIL